MNPIWKDYDVALVPQTSTAFRISTGGSVIYTGRAYPRPGDANIIVRINGICADYMRNAFLDSGSTYAVTFLVEEYDTTLESWEEVVEVTFFDDWSYDYAYIPEVDGLAFPVVLTFAPGQVLLYSALGGAPLATITDEDGTIHSATMSDHFTEADFTTDFNGDFARSALLYGSAYGLYLRNYPNAKYVEIGGKKWVRSDACPRYVLYYKNTHGGWDALPLEGRVTKQDNLTRHTAERVYNNGRSYERGRTNYVNEIGRRWTLRTGWLDGGQSARMHHPLNSPDPFLHDLATGLIHPVTLTASVTEYKDQAGQLHSYAFDAELAQERIRR